MQRLYTLVGQSSNVAFTCSKDADCPMKCIGAYVKYDLTTHQCYCHPNIPSANNKRAKRVHKTNRGLVYVRYYFAN